MEFPQRVKIIVADILKARLCFSTERTDIDRLQGRTPSLLRLNPGHGLDLPDLLANLSPELSCVPIP